MLKHEDTPQTQFQSAAQVRVTPEELAAAITALQIRKEGQPGTIAIGDAVEELGLDVTPEEVLAEVQARRQAALKRTRQSRGQRFVLALGLAGVLLGLGVEGQFFLQKHPQPIIFKPVQAAATSAAIRPKPGMQSVEATPDGQDFWIDDHALTQIFQKTPLTQIMAHRTQANYGEPWHMIKHDGKVYLVAFTPPKSERQLEQNHVALYSGPPEGFTMTLENGQDNYIAVTVPIADVRLEDAQIYERAEKITVSNLHPDSHLWEVSL